ncbi:NeuD/PglB/VioB family sugar acetyltransferase [Lachnospiraceae bacterium NSJ-143]|nr:NeuD/PglB/VioB family sugar acetyltransferase [Lachnospiraceae bacterium NSJ-143]
MKNLVIIGGSGFARELTWLIEENNKECLEWNILGYISEPVVDTKLKYPILGDDNWLLNYEQTIYAACGVGNPYLRKKITEKFKDKKNIIFPNLISKCATVNKDTKFGKGCIVCAGTVINVDVEIGDFLLCNMSCVVSHDDIIGDYVTLDPNSNLLGFVTVGSYTEIGTGVQILPGKSVGNSVVVGAGAVVNKNLPDNCTAVGVPAKIIKYNK